MRPKPFCSQGSTVAPVILNDNRGAQESNDSEAGELTANTSIKTGTCDNASHNDDSHCSLSILIHTDP